MATFKTTCIDDRSLHGGLGVHIKQLHNEFVWQKWMKRIVLKKDLSIYSGHVQ